MQELRLNDIADDLFIMSKATVDILFKQDSCVDLVALYSFYYKTAKWQKTNSIKATDEYVKKCLSWGKDKVRRNKSKLKELGLINIIQRREKGKVVGWYVEVNYLVTNKKSNIIVQEDLFQEDLSSRTGSQDTNALINKVKMLEELNNNILKENKDLKNEIKKLKPSTKKEEFILSKEEYLQQPLREWLEYRKKLVEEKQWEFQYKKLKSCNNPARAVEFSIGNGYTGLFDEKTNNFNKSKQQSVLDRDF